MRLLLFFSLDKAEMPLDNRRVILSFIKHAISEYDKDFFEEIYGTKEAKSYTFSIRLPRPQFLKEKIVLSEPEFTMCFSCADMKYSMVFYNALLKQRNADYPLPGGNFCHLKKIVLLPEKRIMSDTVNIKMLSPIVIRIHDREKYGNKDRYIDCTSEDFPEQLRDTVEYQLRCMNIDESMASDFSVRCIDARKTVLFGYRRKINATIGILQLKGNPLLLNLLYQAGIGSQRSLGMGNFEVI